MTGGGGQAWKGDAGGVFGRREFKEEEESTGGLQG